MDGEDLNRKLNDAVTAMMTKIDRDRLRPIQKQTYLRIAQCYDNKTASSQEIEQCVRGHSALMQSIQNAINQEMNSFQNRLQRCSVACEDEVHDKFGSNSQDITGMQKQMYKCSSNCVDKHITLLKSIQGNLESQIDNAAKQFK